jgi:archaellum component FlaC
MHHERFLAVAVVAVREAIHQTKVQLALLLSAGGLITWIKSTDWTDVLTKTVALGTTALFLGFALLGKFDELRLARRKRLEDANRKSLGEEVKQLKQGLTQLRKQSDAERVESARLRIELGETRDDLSEASKRFHEADDALYRALTHNAEQTEQVKHLRAEVETLRAELAKLRGATVKVAHMAKATKDRLDHSSSSDLPTIPAEAKPEAPQP